MKSDIRIVENYEIKELNKLRTLRIYLPPDYEKGNKNYPVLYMHDGQNLFHDETASYGKSWKIAETLDRMFYNGETEGIIVVGIDNSRADNGLDRLNEYSPWVNEEIGKFISWATVDYPLGGEGQKYAEFIVNTLKKDIDKNFRTKKGKEYTGIAGSSMGGLISLYIGLKYQDIFSKIGVFSPAFFFKQDKTNDFVRKSNIGEHVKIYMDIGTEETSDESIPDFNKIYVNMAQEMDLILKNEKGIKRENIKFIIDEGARHEEEAWAKRFPEAVKWLYI